MTRGHAREVAQAKNAKKLEQQKKQQAAPKGASENKSLTLQCTICLASLPKTAPLNQLEAHVLAKHAKKTVHDCFPNAQNLPPKAEVKAAAPAPAPAPSAPAPAPASSPSPALLGAATGDEEKEKKEKKEKKAKAVGEKKEKVVGEKKEKVVGEKKEKVVGEKKEKVVGEKKEKKEKPDGKEDQPNGADVSVADGASGAGDAVVGASNSAPAAAAPVKKEKEGPKKVKAKAKD